MARKSSADPLKESPAAFARRIGVHRSAIYRAVTAGRLVLHDGQLNIDESLRRWNATKPGTRPDVLARNAAMRQTKSAATDEPGEETTGSVSEYTQQLLSAQNSLARLAIDLRTFKRYPLASIEREAQALGSTLRGALERLVDQTAPRLAVCSDDAQRAVILGEEVTRIRQTMRREIPRAMRRLRQADRAKP